MNEQSSSEIASEVVSKTAEKVYDELISPSAKPIGTVISLLPRTVRLIFSRWEKWVINGERSLELTAEAIQTKIAKIPEDKLTEPEPFVICPAINQLSYCFDSNELREMYANLIVSSMNKDKKWEVHPAFVDIIKQLTPDEARILKKMRSDLIFPFPIYHPIIDLILIEEQKSSQHKTLKRNLTNFALEYCENPENITEYFDNLNRLKLIDIDMQSYFVLDKKYDELIEFANSIKDIKSFVLPTQKIDYHKGTFCLTDFGKKLIKICLS